MSVCNGWVAATAVTILLLTNSTCIAEAPNNDTAPQPRMSVLHSQMIWDAAPHNAFTDLIRWKDRWYCSFREGSAHASDDGRVRILRSDDGKKWESLAQFAEDGHDLRDPKICVLCEQLELTLALVHYCMKRLPDWGVTRS